MDIYSWASGTLKTTTTLKVIPIGLLLLRFHRWTVDACAIIGSDILYQVVSLSVLIGGNLQVAVFL